jgi:hypothetical protein
MRSESLAAPSFSRRRPPLLTHFRHAYILIFETNDIVSDVGFRA